MVIVPLLLLELAEPVSAGAELLRFKPLLLTSVDMEPLCAGQYLRIGWELRIILEVGERWVRLAPLDDQHPCTDEVERMEQIERAPGWYRLTPSGACSPLSRVPR